MFVCFFGFFFNVTATTEIYTYGHTLSLHDALPSYEKGGRTDERDLRPSLPAAAHGPSLLHRLWAVGASGHGDVAVHRRNIEEPADQGVQPRQPEARFHIHRRHRFRPGRLPGPPVPNRTSVVEGKGVCRPVYTGCICYI